MDRADFAVYSSDLGDMQSADDDPGKIRPGADIKGASFHSYLTHSANGTRFHRLNRMRSVSAFLSLAVEQTNPGLPAICRVIGRILPAVVR